MIEQAIILAGGFGTRLHPLTLDTPKPLLPVGNRPFLETQFYRLKQAGVKRVVLSVYHQAGLLKKALRNLEKFGLKVSLVKEPRPLGTGGAIAWAWPDRKKPCLVLNGDVLSDFEIGEMSQAHSKNGGKATLWVTQVADTSAFGVIECDSLGRIRRFIEKPRNGESPSKWINAGLYVLSSEVLRLIPAGKAVSIERETFPALLREGLPAFAYAGSGKPYWNDIGTPAAYLRANMDILAGRLKLGTLWKGLKGNSVIAANCKLGRATQIEGSVILTGCKIGEGAQIRGAVIGLGCVIGARARIREAAVLGRGTIISEGSHA